MGTIAEKLAYTKQAREEIRSTIVDMGVDCPGAAPFCEFDEYMRQIRTGVDTSEDTVTADTMLEGITAHDSAGEQIIGAIPYYDGAASGGLIQPPATMYSYNGTVLPALPEWDKEKYPYAVLIDPTETYYELYCSAEPITYNPNSAISAFTVSAPYIMCDTETLNEEGVYVRNEAFSEFGNEKTTSKVLSKILNKILWSNHDVIKTTDSTVYLSASEPIPVYE